jgi:hypothetical protein
MASVSSPLEPGAEEAAVFSPSDPMPFGLYLQGDPVKEKAILVRDNLVGRPACRCAACESLRGLRLAQALRNKFGRGLSPAAWRSH